VKLAIITGAIGFCLSAPCFAGHDHDRKSFNKSKYHQKNFSFAIIGDGPYGEDQEHKYDTLIKDINKDRDVSFVIHAGDIKSGGEMCTDELLTRRFNQFQKIRRPLVYTPGDNEWTDCHRTSNGSYLPTERLGFIRGLFFPHPNWTTGGKKMRVKTQADTAEYSQFVENTMFTKKGIVFSQVHVVGSNNNLRPWDQLPEGDRLEERMAEFKARNQASLAWLKKSFKVANYRNAKAIFITIHANPNFDIDRAEEGSRSGFNDFLDVLAKETLKFKKPVVLAHGDSHLFRIDMPRLVPWYRTGDAATAEENVKIGNLTRIETFGHFDNHWIKIEVDPADESVFRFIPQVVKSNL